MLYLPQVSNSSQMRRIEKTVTGVSGATAREFGFGIAECNKMKICVMCESIVETTTLGDAIGLNDACDYHDANSGMKLANLLRELDYRLARIDY